MSPWMRCMRFNFAGILGMAVQLGALAVINRGMPGHYLLATAGAIEIALLHNFGWHLRYTWCDRRPGRVLRSLVRFHLSNGLVSMIGNLVLMRGLVQQLQIPVLAANAIAITCCSLVNFLLGDTWVFAATTKVVPNPGLPG